MKATLLKADTAKSRGLILTPKEKGTHAVYLAIVALRSNRRANTAHTKKRGEVRGSGKKLWRQKGTGNARVGDKKAPHRRGGGVAHGPRNTRNYTKKVNRRVMELAYRKALTERIEAEEFYLLDDLQVADGKTKTFARNFAKISDAKKNLLISSDYDIKTRNAIRNIPLVTLQKPEQTTVEDLIGYHKIFCKDADLDKLIEMSGKPGKAELEVVEAA